MGDGFVAPAEEREDLFEYLPSKKVSGAVRLIVRKPALLFRPIVNRGTGPGLFNSPSPA
jgi:hypothetical protein